MQKKAFFDEWKSVGPFTKLSWIATLFGVALSAYSLKSNTDLLKKVSAIIIASMLILICILLLLREKFFMKYLHQQIQACNEKKISDICLINNVFSVSAIIVDEEGKFLLIKKFNNENNKEGYLYAQPGKVYVTNRVYTKTEFNNDKEDVIEKKLVTPYKKILKSLRETGINIDNIELINMSYFPYREDTKLKDTLKEQKISNFTFYEDYLNNEFSPPPFLIEKEVVNEKKSKSNEKEHIDMYYAFKIKKKIKSENSDSKNSESENSNCVFFSLKDIEKMVNEQEHTIHKDLYFVCKKFNDIYLQTNRPKHSIRFCTLNSEKKDIIYWRLTKKCNSSCEYCMLGKKKETVKNEFIEIADYKQTIEKLRKTLPSNKEYKLVLTGGEPLLIKNISEIINQVMQQPAIKEISLCTNGLLGEERYEIFKKIYSVYKEKFKVVINLPTYDSKFYYELKKSPNSNFNDVEKFIKHLNKDNRNFCINTVLTDEFTGDDKIANYIKYWRNLNIKDVSLTYVIRNECNTNTNIRYKDKNEAIDIYEKMINGVYGEVSFLNNFELIIPDCNNEYCGSVKNIFSIDENIVYQKCLEK